MSFTKMVTARCDAGAETGYAAECEDMCESSGWTVAEAWSYAQDAGWHRNGQRTICPICWARGER